MKASTTNVLPAVVMCRHAMRSRGKEGSLKQEDMQGGRLKAAPIVDCHFQCHAIVDLEACLDGKMTCGICGSNGSVFKIYCAPLEDVKTSW